MDGACTGGEGDDGPSVAEAIVVFQLRPSRHDDDDDDDDRRGR